MTSIILCITSGRGPRECRIAARIIAQKIEEEAKKIGITVASAAHAVDMDNYPSSILMSLEGDHIAPFIQSWLGTIQWIAKSPFRGKRARQNWFIGVYTLDKQPETKNFDESDVLFETMRAGGPGGQHQNKTESAVRALHLPTGLVCEARDGRSQFQNKAKALARLRDLISAQENQKRNAVNHKEWLDRIFVERGSPKRVYEGGIQKTK